MPTALYSQKKGRSSGKSSALPTIKDIREVKKKKPLEYEKRQPITSPAVLPITAIPPLSFKIVNKAGINFATAGVHTIIPKELGIQFFIVMITFTVGGATDITLYDGDFPFSGPMDFGGTDEPRGIVIPMAQAPLMLGKDLAFKIGSTAAVQVSGFVTYTTEASEPPPETPA